MPVVPLDKSVYVFAIDDVLYPKRDYLLQVYYLFANFVEFTEGKPVAKELLAYMKYTYEREGEAGLLAKTLAAFELPEAYVANYERLEANAQLPLKLILIDKTKDLLEALFAAEKKFAILTDGNPVEELNKLKHIDWEDLTAIKNQLKVFFTKELDFRGIDAIAFIAESFAVESAEIQFVNYD